MRLILLTVIAAFPVSEIALAFMKRSRGRPARSEDRGSMRLIWLGVALGIVLAIGFQWAPFARIPLSLSILRVSALLLLISGLAIRWTAILTLGKLFTVDVAIHSDHAVVERGLYRFVRHPSYTGLFIAFVGLGVCFANWLSIIGLLVPITFAILKRVAQEEQVLLASLGPAYAVYRERTKRFIPYLL
jgi:protein-S-isoprenylcysteine O-methyltransferase